MDGFLLYERPLLIIILMEDAKCFFFFNICLMYLWQIEKLVYTQAKFRKDVKFSYKIILLMCNFCIYRYIVT